ncbi:MAG: lipoyl synthase, partial [Chloroflexi bacterium]|nr:lipoyl synthase [Chloroflexota bacterium]
IRRIRERTPDCAVEVLIPDIMGHWDALREDVEAKPQVLNHNTETVPRLYKRVRHKARYERSIELLWRAKRMDPTLVTKSGLMVGLGETMDELREVMADLREAECDVLTLGQYLRPSPTHAPVARFYAPEEFRQLRDVGLGMGFRHMESGPLVRSSYHAHEHVPGREA